LLWKVAMPIRPTGGDGRSGRTYVPESKVLLVPLVTARVVSTDKSGGLVTIDLTTDQIRYLGAFCEGIRVHHATENITALMRWKVVGQSSTTGRTFGAAFDLTPFLTTITDGPATEITNTDLFGVDMRFGIVAQPVSGTAIESATVWAWLAFRFRT